MKKIVSVVNQKGGVGKTTIANNLGYNLSVKGYKVLMLDLDSQGDLTTLTLEEVDNERNIVGVLNDKYPAAEAIREIYNNFNVISGHSDSVHFKTFGASDNLKKKLRNKALESYDFVIIDHPPNLNEVSLQGIVASDYVLIITDAESLSIKNVSSFMDDLMAIKKSLNANWSVLGIVINRVDNRRSLTRRKIKQLTEAVGSHVFETMIGNDTAFPIAADQKIPVRNLKWSGKAKQQLSILSDEFLKRLELM